MSHTRSLRVRPSLPPNTSRPAPFRAYVSAAVLELYGGKSGTSAWVFGRNPTPVTLWREQASTKGPKVEPIGNGAVLLSETVCRMAGVSLGDDVELMQEQDAIGTANEVVLEEHNGVFDSSAPSNASRSEVTNTTSNGNPDSVDQSMLALRAKEVLNLTEYACCGQELELAGDQNSHCVYKVLKINGSQERRLLKTSLTIKVVFVTQQLQDMRIPRDIFAGSQSQADEIDGMLSQFKDAPPRRFSANRQTSCMMLLTGPTGVGKSLIIECVSRLAWPKVHRINSSVKGVKDLASTFQEAARYKRALVLIDNIEEAARAQKGQANMWAKQLLNSIHELQKDRSQRILVVAATTDVEDLDPSLLKPDGFDPTIRIGLPQPEARSQIIATVMDDELPSEALDEISRRTHAFSGSDLLRLCRHISKYRDEEDDRRDRGVTCSLQPRSEPTNHSAAEWMSYADKALRSVRPTTMRGVHVEVPETRFNDIGGQQELKNRLDLELRQPLLHPELWKKMGLKPGKGILMYGPPGCSKTLMARAVATEFSFNFLLVNASELISSYVGESEKRLRELFQQARDASPCIIFFDEFEALAAERGSRETHGGLNTVNTLLTEMDGVKPLENVFVLAATNKPNMLDPALLRHGRLHPHFLVGLPDLEARKDIIHISLRRVQDDVKSSDIQVDDYAVATKGLTGAQVAGFVEEALRAASATGEVLSHKHFEQAKVTIEPTVTPDDIAFFEQWGAKTG